MGRERRFVDFIGFETSDTASAPKGFFSGEKVKKRMDDMRKAILYVRENWDNDELKKKAAKDLEEKFKISVADVNWFDVCDSDAAYDFDLIKIYTSVKGYDYYFGKMNCALRQINSANLEEDLTLKDDINKMAFFIEFLNVELYNYMHKKRRTANFEGCVYRGMRVSTDMINFFKNLKNKYITERGISVPLAFTSASRKKKVAIEMISKDIEAEEKIETKKTENQEKQENLVMKIHVASLSRKNLLLYHKFFPNSVVSSLCAVPIQKLSIYKYEKEVLLRGAFFHLLDFYKSDKDFINGKPVYVAEVFMMNSNRDHLTTSQFEGTPARKLFNALVNIDKFKKARDFVRNNAEIKSYIDEEQKWREKLQDVLQELENGK